MPTTVTRDNSRAIRPVPAGCGQQRWPERRVQWPDTVPTDYGSAVEGGIHADPVPSGSVLSMRRHRRTRTTVLLAFALAVTGYIVRAVWPLLGA